MTRNIILSETIHSQKNLPDKVYFIDLTNFGNDFNDIFSLSMPDVKNCDYRIFYSSCLRTSYSLKTIELNCKVSK